MRYAACAVLGVVVLAAGLVLFGASSALAENLGPGGGTRIIAGDQVFGPYRVYATVSPEPAQTGTLTFVVRLSDPISGVKVRDAVVVVELTESAIGTSVTGEATHPNAGNDLDYAAHISIEQAGVYYGTIRISGPAGQAEVPFQQQVVAPRRLATLLAIGLPFAVILVVLGGIWFVRSGGVKGE